METQNDTHGMQLVEARSGQAIGDYLRERYEARGMSLAQIAAEMGVGTTTAWRWMRRAGITTRPVGRKPAA